MDDVTAQNIDANTVEVDVPGVGTIVVMRATDEDTNQPTARLLYDGPMDTLPTLEPA